MKEWVGVRQIPGESKRRWFSSAEFDLIVWVSDSHDFSGFELCYDKLHNEHSILWSKAKGFCHMAVDDGSKDRENTRERPSWFLTGVSTPDASICHFLKPAAHCPKKSPNLSCRRLNATRIIPGKHKMGRA